MWKRTQLCGAAADVPASGPSLVFETLPMVAGLLNEEDKLVLVNPCFVEDMGPLHRYRNLPFVETGADDKAKDAIRDALRKLKEASEVKDGTRRVKLRDVNLLTMTGPDGFPTARHFDLTMSFQDFLQKAPIAMHWLSSTGHIMWANDTELRVLGYTREEYIGRPIMDFCPDEAEIVLEIFKQLGSGNAIKDVPVRFRAKNGNIVPLLIDSNVNYTAAGEFNHTRCFIRDDTGRKVREAQTEVQLSEAKRTAQLFDKFVSRTLHLIRTPCHLLMHNLEELRDNGGDDQAKMATLLTDCAQLVSKVVQMSRDFSDVIRFDECATMIVKPAQHNLRAIARAAIDGAQHYCRQSVDLRADVAAGGESIRTDADVLNRVLLHLLRNAAQATSAGSVTLRITHAAETVTIAVEDTGKGLDSSDTNTFQRYRQPSAKALNDANAESLRLDREKLEKDLALSSGNEGIGIGLSLCYSLVHALGAELRFESRPGATRFWFTLQRDSAAAGNPAPAEVYRPPLGVEALSSSFAAQVRPVGGSASATWEMPVKPNITPGIVGMPKLAFDTHRAAIEATQASWLAVPPTTLTASAACIAERGVFEAQRAKCVLVVDDSPFCMMVICSRLKHLGFTYDTAEDGVEAIAKLMVATPGEYALVLMDLRMPNMDGYEATRIAKDELKVTIPIVAVSAETEVDTAKFDGFEVKPLTVERLCALLREHTGVDVDLTDRRSDSELTPWSTKEPPIKETSREASGRRQHPKA